MNQKPIRMAEDGLFLAERYAGYVAGLKPRITLKIQFMDNSKEDHQFVPVKIDNGNADSVYWCEVKSLTLFSQATGICLSSPNTRIIFS